MLSPHIGVQTLGVAPAGLVHSKPVSIFQEASQPSLGAMSPSSHCSGEVVMPSPQTMEHTLGPSPVAIEHCQPTSTLQLASHPSPGAVSPSSHLFGSVLYRTPSPHISEQVSGDVAVPPEQVQ